MLLAGIQSGRARNRRAAPGAIAPRPGRPRTFAVATVVCLILLALMAVVQIAHVHPLESEADHCPLCVVMHAVAPVAVTAAVIILVQVGTPGADPRNARGDSTLESDLIYAAAAYCLLAAPYPFSFQLIAFPRCFPSGGIRFNSSS